MFDPTSAMNYLPGADNLAAAWAGRNAGIGLAMAVAIWLKNPAAYAAVYMAAIVREIGDSYGIFSGYINMVGIIGISLFFMLDIYIFVISLKAAIRQRNAKTKV